MQRWARYQMVRGNCFDLLRLAAALCVLVGHSWVLTSSEPAPRVANIPLHTLGVAVFFSISGYLIASSWTRQPSLNRFFARRIRRIFPGVITVVLITVFVVGPATSSLAPAAYFSDSQTWSYLQNLLLLGQYELPGVFDGEQYSRSTVNGSLWTLGVEFCCYTGVAAIGLLLRTAPKPRAAIVYALAGCSASVAAFALGPGTAAGETASMVTYFAAGALVSFIPSRLATPVPAIAVALLWFVCARLDPALGACISWIAIPLVAVAVGLRETRWASLRDSVGDLSYGTYLYGYLVQQLYIGVGITSFSQNLAFAAPTTLAIAAASWWLVERPALAGGRRSRRAAIKVSTGNGIM